VAVHGSHAFVGTSTGLKIVDISDPAHPAELASLDNLGNARGVAVDSTGNLAVVAARDSVHGDSVYSVDVSDPSNPQVRDDEASCSGRLAVSGHYAYVASYCYGIYIYDISDPDNLQYVTNIYDNDTVYDVAVSGQYLYVARDGSSDNTAALDIYNVSNPASPSWVGGAATGYRFRDVAVQGSYAYVPSRIIDISNPGSPKMKGSLSGSSSVSVKGTYAFAGSYPELYVHNVADPNNPTLEQTLVVGGGGANDLTTDESHLYAAGDYGLAILQITGASGPALKEWPNPEMDAGFAYNFSLIDQCPSSNCSVAKALQTGERFPPGLALLANGTVKGKPSRPGTYTFTLKITDRATGQWTTKTYSSIVVYPRLTNRTARTAKVWKGRSLLVPLAVDGGKPPYAWDLRDASPTRPRPDWVSIDASHPDACSPEPCLLIGTVPATAAGSYQFSLVVTDSLGVTSSLRFSVAVPSAAPPDPDPSAPDLELGPWPLDPMTAGQPVSTTLPITGPADTKVFKVKVWNEKLPPGVNVDAKGIIKGKPTTTGTYSFHLMLEDPYHRTIVRKYTVTVNAPSP
jgi:hypothetical protein